MLISLTSVDTDYSLVDVYIAVSRANLTLVHIEKKV